MTVLKFTLTDIPPSVNRMYRVYRGNVVKSAEYTSWIRSAGFELSAQLGFPGNMKETPFLWRSDILFPCNRSNIDVDNAPKAIHDLLVNLGKVPDDRYLVDARIRWSKGDKIVIAIKKEDLSKWTAIKKISSSLTQKLAKYSQ